MPVSRSTVHALLPLFHCQKLQAPVEGRLNILVLNEKLSSVALPGYPLVDGAPTATHSPAPKPRSHLGLTVSYYDSCQDFMPRFKRVYLLPASGPYTRKVRQPSLLIITPHILYALAPWVSIDFVS
jgi:hypothetical protein